MLRRSPTLVMVISFAALAMSAACPCRAQSDRWAVDFGQGLDGGASCVFVKRTTGEVQNHRLIKDFRQGLLNLGGKFDNESFVGSGDYAAIEWTKVPAIPVKDYPLLEIRCWIPKDSTLLVMPTYRFENGATNMPYFSFGPEQPDGWKTMSLRIAGDGSLPKKWTPRTLVGLHLRLQASPRPASNQKMDGSAGERVLKLSWVRMRRFTREEQASEDQWVSLMRDFKPSPSQSLRKFFPFGVYGFHFSRYGDHTNYYLTSSRHVNFVMDVAAGDAVRIFGLAEKMGLKIGLRCRSAEAIFAKDGAQGVRTQMKPLIDLASKSKAVFGYDMGDEPSLSRLHGISAALRIIHEMDPAKPAWVNFWDLSVLKSYTPYAAFFSTDLYPLATSNSGDPAEAFSQCRQVAAENENQQQIIILQAFGMQPWIKDGYRAPTPEEVRLQTWAALAGGASGIVYYCFDCYCPDRYLYKTLIDPFGNPHPNFDEVARLGEQIIPLGYALLDSRADLVDAAACQNKDILVGVRRPENGGTRYVVIVNKNLKTAQDAVVSLPDSWQTPGIGAYDLVNMRQVSFTAGSMTVRKLAPAEGILVMIGTVSEFARVRQLIESQQVRETLRFRLPDLAVAKSYRADVRKVEEFRADAEAALQVGGTNAARAKATQAGAELDSLLDNLATYRSLRKRLSDAGRLMGSVEMAMYPENPKWSTKMVPLRGPFWELQKRWSTSLERVLKADTQGPAREVQAIETEAAKVVKQARDTIGSEGLY